MRIEYLREFLAIAEKGSFSQAALALHISQPALSNHIQAMERELGAGALLDRSKGSNGARLTPPARDFYSSMRMLVEDYDRAVARLRTAAAESRGHIAVALSPVSPAASARMVAVLNEFERAHPSIDVEVAFDLPANLPEALDQHQVDCAVLVQRVSPDVERYPTVHLTDEELCVLMPASHPLACNGQKAVPVSALAHYAEVHRAHGAFDMTAAFHTRTFAPYGVAPTFSLRSAPSFDDFMVREIHGRDLVVMPASFRESSQFHLRSDLVLLPFEPRVTAPVDVIFRAGDDAPGIADLAAFIAQGGAGE